MLNWLIHNNKDAPDFYKRYLAKFDKKPNRFVILRTNSSGKNPEKDVLFSIGAVSVVNDQIILADSFEMMIYQYKYLHDQGLSNDFIVASKLPKKHEPAALEDFINFIGNAVIVGYQVHVDFDLLNHALNKLGAGRLKNDALDLEIMQRKWKDVDKHLSFENILLQHDTKMEELSTISEEAYAMALIFLTLKTKLGIK